MLTKLPIWRLVLPAIALFAGVLYLLAPTTFSSRLRLYSAGLQSGGEGPINATLGFGAILALTDDDSSWRTEGLRLAAKHLGLHVQIPLQDHISEEDVLRYLEGDDLHTEIGSVKATMSYLSLLQQFLDTGAETALLIEDDADFSIHIKDQLDSLSKAMWRDVVDVDIEQSASRPRRPRRQAPANPPARLDRMSDPFHSEDWDILWLGHCGIESTNAIATRTYSDPKALPWSRLTSTFNNYYEQMLSNEQLRSLQVQQILYNATALSTYAWAITRSHAQWLLAELRSSRTQEFDIALHVRCKGGKQRCAIPVPELMHHHKVLGEVAISTQGNGTVARKDLGWWRGAHKYTYNVEWSARCNAAGVGEKLAEGWQCLPGKYDDVV